MSFTIDVGPHGEVDDGLRYDLEVLLTNADGEDVGAFKLHGGEPGKPSRVWGRGVISQGVEMDVFIAKFFEMLAKDIRETARRPGGDA